MGDLTFGLTSRVDGLVLLMIGSNECSASSVVIDLTVLVNT